MEFCAKELNWRVDDYAIYRKISNISVKYFGVGDAVNNGDTIDKREFTSSDLLCAVDYVVSGKVYCTVESRDARRVERITEAVSRVLNPEFVMRYYVMSQCYSNILMYERRLVVSKKHEKDAGELDKCTEMFKYRKNTKELEKDVAVYKSKIKNFRNCVEMLEKNVAGVFAKEIELLNKEIAILENMVEVFQLGLGEIKGEDGSSRVEDEFLKEDGELVAKNDESSEKSSKVFEEFNKLLQDAKGLRAERMKKSDATGDMVTPGGFLLSDDASLFEFLLSCVQGLERLCCVFVNMCKKNKSFLKDLDILEAYRDAGVKENELLVEVDAYDLSHIKVERKNLGRRLNIDNASRQYVLVLSDGVYAEKEENPHTLIPCRNAKTQKRSHGDSVLVAQSQSNTNKVQEKSNMGCCTPCTKVVVTVAFLAVSGAAMGVLWHYGVIRI